jgi:hypothetical protein
MKNLIPSHLHSVGWYTGAGPTAAAGPTSFLPFPCVSAERAAVSSSRVRFDSAAPLSRPRQIRVRCNKGVCVSPEWFSVRNYSSRKGLALFFFEVCQREEEGAEPCSIPPSLLDCSACVVFLFTATFLFRPSVLVSFFGGDWRLVRGASISLHHLGGWDGCVCMLAYIAPWRRLGENPSSGSVSADTFSRRRRNFSLLRWAPVTGRHATFV